MSTVLDGVRGVELASWTYVPSAGAALADWGADVIKVESVATGDPDAAILSTRRLLDNAALRKNRVFFGDFTFFLQQTLYRRTFRHVPLQLSLCTRPQIFVFS